MIRIVMGMTLQNTPSGLLLPQVPMSWCSTL